MYDLKSLSVDLRRFQQQPLEAKWGGSAVHVKPPAAAEAAASSKQHDPPVLDVVLILARIHDELHKLAANKSVSAHRYYMNPKSRACACSGGTNP